jgi:transcription initiation factor TFIID subunit 5
MNSLALSPDGSVVAAGFSDSSVKMWDMLGGRSKLRAVGKQWQTSDGRDKHYQSVQVQRENEEYSELVAHSQPVYGLSFSPDNKFLLSSSADGTVRLWSSEGRTNLVAYRGHNYPVWDVKFSPFGYYFVTASSDRTARLWTTSNPFPVRIFAGHLSDVNVRLPCATITTKQRY